MRLRLAAPALVLCAAVVMPAAATNAAADPGEPVAPTSAAGISVTGVTRVSARTWRIDLASPNISTSYATKSGLSVRVTLPAGYEASTKRYPSLYLLHGQDGTSADWTSGLGDAERITAGQDVIVVTPEGGKAGWYTDWVRQWAGKQNWETFHVKQLIPFIDANFRTMASRDHRAIAGLSMGGYGAMHYASKYPQLFAHASSYSGGVNLSTPGLRFAVVGSVDKQLLGIDAPFGSVVPGFDAKWHAENPVDQAANLRGMGVSIYTGDGKGSSKDVVGNIIEQGAAQASNDLHARLDQLGIPHTWVNYGHDVTKAGYACDGSHNYACWNMALALDLPAIMRDIA